MVRGPVKRSYQNITSNVNMKLVKSKFPRRPPDNLYNIQNKSGVCVLSIKGAQYGRLMNFNIITARPLHSDLQLGQ